MYGSYYIRESLKVLFSEMDMVKSRFIQYVVIKEWGAEDQSIDQSPSCESPLKNLRYLEQLLAIGILNPNRGTKFIVP